MDKELKEAIEAQGKAFEEFKRKNDERIEKLEGKSADSTSADLIEQIATLNSAISAHGKSIEQIAKETARAKILGEAGDDSKRTPEQIEHKKALTHFMQTGDDHGLKALEAKAMNIGTDPDGGYLVTEEMDAAITRVATVMSALPRMARVVTIGSPAWQKLVKTSGMAMRRVGDGKTGGETTEPKYALIEIPVYEAEVEPWLYNTMLADAPMLEADLTEEAAIGFAEGSAAEFISGDGVGKARGIISYTNIANASYAWGKVGYIASGKSAAFASVAPSDKLIDLQHALKAQYRPGAKFLMSDSTLGIARQMKDSSGSYYLWNPDALAGFGGRFLGSPVEIDDNMPVLGANSYSIAYGDFSQAYAIVNRAGTSLIRDNITAKGTTKFNFRRRFGGGIVNYEAIKLFKMATS